MSLRLTFTNHIVIIMLIQQVLHHIVFELSRKYGSGGNIPPPPSPAR